MFSIEYIQQSKVFWMENFQKEFGYVLKVYMKKSGFTKDELAEELGYPVKLISQILNGNANCKMETVVDITLKIGIAPKIEFRHLDKYL